MVSKANRLKFESEKLFALTKKANDYVVPPPPKPKAPRSANLYAEFNSGPLVTAPVDKDGNVGKSFSICACGDHEPVHKGYCVNCIKKLKARFEKLIEKF